MRRKISPKFHVKNGVKNGKFHAHFTLLGRSADNMLLETIPASNALLALHSSRSFCWNLTCFSTMRICVRCSLYKCPTTLLPSPSFPCSFQAHQRKTSKTSRIFLSVRSLKTLEKTRPRKFAARKTPRQQKHQG